MKTILFLFIAVASFAPVGPSMPPPTCCSNPKSCRKDELPFCARPNAVRLCPLGERKSGGL
jgi:hypothetical protein